MPAAAAPTCSKASSTCKVTAIGSGSMGYLRWPWPVGAGSQFRSKQQVGKIALQLRLGGVGMACPQSLERQHARRGVHLPQHLQLAGNRSGAQQLDEDLLGFRSCVRK